MTITLIIKQFPSGYVDENVSYYMSQLLWSHHPTHDYILIGLYYVDNYVVFNFPSVKEKITNWITAR